MSTVEPIRCTGMTAFVFGPIAAATCSAVIRCVSGSTSTSFGVAPTQLTASAVAMNEFDGTMTSSPGPMSSARSASEMASVPDETPTENAVPQYVGELALEGLELGAHREGALAGDARRRPRAAPRAGSGPPGRGG